MKPVQERLRKMEQIASKVKKEKENIPASSLEKMEGILFRKETVSFKKKAGGQIQDQNVNAENRNWSAGCIIQKRSKAIGDLHAKSTTIKSPMEDFQTVRSINLVSSTRRERVPEEMSQRLEETKEQLTHLAESEQADLFVIQQEKKLLEQQIEELDSQIQHIRSSKLKVVKKSYNWKDERKNFEQLWSSLENEEDMEQVEHFDWNMQAKYQGMDFEDGEEQQQQLDRSVIDQLAEEVEQLMSMAMQNEKEEHDFRKPTSQYLPPLSVIEEEASIEISFQQ